MKHHFHGDTGTRLHRIWKGMKMRCSLKTHPTYKSYGGRGITVCADWIENYPNFKAWALANGYDDTLELDRIDVNGNYTPDNCRWITHHEQTLNRRDTLYIAIDGSIMKFRDFCLQHAINLHTASEWRHYGIEELRIASRIGKPVAVGTKEEVMPYATVEKL